MAISTTLSCGARPVTDSLLRAGYGLQNVGQTITLDKRKAGEHFMAKKKASTKKGSGKAWRKPQPRNFNIGKGTKRL
jgi:hypothetical protein